MISLIITCYNREAHLAQAIQSVLDQTYQDFELIVWDDGSTDNSIEIAQIYARRDSRIKVIDAPHQGYVISISLAIAHSRGEYFGCLDSDDYLSRYCLEKTKEILDSRFNLGVVYTWYGRVDSIGNFLGIGHRCQVPFSKDRMLFSHITFHFRCIKRKVYDAVGGINTNFKYASDYDLCLRLAEVTDFYQLSQLLYYYREHSLSMGSTSNGEQEQYAWLAINQAIQRRGLDYSHFNKYIGKYTQVN